MLEPLRSPTQQLRREATRLQFYGAAALLETFYSGVEKALTRIAGATGSVPEGTAGHRQWLDDGTLERPQIRPAVLSESTARRLEPYLAFRHRLRNLCLFDLDARVVLPLLADAPTAWAAAAADLGTFAAHLDTRADECDAGAAGCQRRAAGGLGFSRGDRRHLPGVLTPASV